MEELEGLVDPLVAWYRQNRRDLPWRREVSPYRVWISEIMLQQTRVEAVKGYFTRFVGELPDAYALAQIPQERLLKLWEGLGYYSRARSLQKAAILLCERYGGELPADHAALLGLPGIGPYTAGAIGSIAFGLPTPAVDGNVLRVRARICADDADIALPATRKAAEAAVARVIPHDCPGDFNQAMMELGATVCLPNGPPACGRCPVADGCAAKRRGLCGQLPVKSAKKPRKIEPRTILLLLRDGRLAIRRRPGKGLLAGLWELPSEAGELDLAQVVETVRAAGLEPVRAERLPDAKHIFTHIEWRMSGWRVTVADARETAGLVWADARELRERYALPSAFGAFLGDFLAQYGG